MEQKCDFCDEVRDDVYFDPDWDAAICEDCSTEQKEEIKRIKQGLRPKFGQERNEHERD